MHVHVMQKKDITTVTLTAAVGIERYFPEGRDSKRAVSWESVIGMYHESRESDLQSARFLSPLWESPGRPAKVLSGGKRDSGLSPYKKALSARMSPCAHHIATREVQPVKHLDNHETLTETKQSHVTGLQLHMLLA